MTVKHIIKIKESIKTLEQLKNNPTPQKIMDFDKQFKNESELIMEEKQSKLTKQLQNLWILLNN